jgi:hypothetical protein
MLELEVKRGYVTATEAARIEGISRQAINQRLKAGRIKGAFLMDCGDGREIWVVPRKQLKPKKESEL